MDRKPGGLRSAPLESESGSALRRYFGHAAFRPGQEEIINAVLAGEDVLVVMPTGSGKSLGYQLPALLLPGTTLVVSPLIALMKDQVDELARKGIRAAALHSLLTPEERRAALADARAGMLRLLYVAPERFASERFGELLAELPIARFAVDEAHCVSEWGHDFRPDYRSLAAAAERCRRSDGASGRPPILAFTATATPEVRADIVKLLGLREPRTFVTGFDRPNLFLDVRKVSGEIEKRLLLPELVAGHRALVYAATRKSAERAAEALQSAGISAGTYHAGLSESERLRVQNRFAEGALRVVCATNAFGMGIDRPDVEAVIHFEIPGSLEAYYQEIGRGGRDGRETRAVLLWNYVDVRTREFLIQREGEEESPRFRRPALDPAERESKRELDRRKLRRIIAWADSTGCYRVAVLRYFGEEVSFEHCGACGNCERRRPLPAEDLLLLRKVLSGVVRAQERWGKRKLVAMLRGDLEGLPESLKGLSTTGLLREQSAKQIGDWIEAAIGAGLLTASADVYRTLSLTPAGREVMAGRITEVALTLPQSAPRKRARPKKRALADLSLSHREKPARRSFGEGGLGVRGEDPPPSDLVEVLKGWRRREAARRSVPAYVVFSDKTVAALASLRPETSEALAEVPGIGPAKLAAYGETLLTMLTSGKAVPSPPTLPAARFARRGLRPRPARSQARADPSHTPAEGEGKKGA